jgi:PPOX class probable F420-dependent enzyme
MAIKDEKYVVLTTFRRDGRPVATPVWWVELADGEYGFSTGAASGKVKRLAHTSRVTVQPSNARGVVKAGTEPVEGTARLVTGAELDSLRQKLVAKYGVQAKLATLATRARGALKGNSADSGNCGVVVKL